VEFSDDVVVADFGGLPGDFGIVLLWVALILLARPDREPFSIVTTLLVIGTVATVTSISSWNRRLPPYGTC